LKKLLTLPVLFIVLQTQAQSVWKQSLHYEIHITFHPAEKSADAWMKLQYLNRSPDTLTYIWFNVWPNAYRNDRTQYTDQLLENGDTRFYFSTKEQKGYLNRLDFRVNGSLARIEDHPEFMDVVKCILPKPLLPGDSVTIVSSFHLRLPFNFNGYGYGVRHVEVRNWYPEPAVYDSKGWHPMTFLVQGGAYHEAADYEVDMEAPPAYKIATGALADTISRSVDSNHYHFSIKNANAFSWIADTKYAVKTDTLQLDGRQITLQYFYLTSPPFGDFNKIFQTTKAYIRQLSQWLMPYPHSNLSLVQADHIEDQDFSGVLSIPAKSNSNQFTTALRREMLGQWFQTMLMSDQRDQPWLSKGMMKYYDNRLIHQFPKDFPRGFPYPADILWLRVAENQRTTQPISQAAPKFTATNDSLIPATKASLWLSLLEDSMGIKSFDRIMPEYFSVWQFNHPDSTQFKRIADSLSHKNLQLLFDKLNAPASLFPASEKRILKPTYIFSARNSEKYNYIGFAPAVGYNKYDDFMLGTVIHNINLPANKFEFLATPLYAFGSKELVGLGRLSYTWRPDNYFSRITIGLNGGHFNTNKATDSSGHVLFEYFSKLVPYIRVDFRNSNPRSHISRWMDFSSFLIKEQSFGGYGLSSKDSLYHPNSVSTSFRYVNQLTFNLQDTRVLYPYDLRVEVQQSELFYRINLHANYFLNYPQGGGLQVRFFAAKFGAWNNSNNLDLSRYEPQLLGVDGEEDYLYQDYFIARSATYAQIKSSIPDQGYAAQQIMIRDGGLKLRIDDLTYLQGKSSNWVTALNFTSSFPAKMFPFPVPLRLFFDVGTYAEAWEPNATTSHFLYTGGVQLSLFKNVLNIYAPLIYSSDFDQALNGVNFGRRITFSIDIQNIDYKWILKKRIPVYE
jgi:hypothetical protein